MQKPHILRNMLQSFTVLEYIFPVIGAVVFRYKRFLLGRQLQLRTDLQKAKTSVAELKDQRLQDNNCKQQIVKKALTGSLLLDEAGPILSL